jgi:hypothetical protein
MRICRGNQNSAKLLTEISDTAHEDQCDIHSVGSDNIDNAMFGCHVDAFSFYYISDSDILHPIYKRKELLRCNGINCYAKLHSATLYAQCYVIRKVLILLLLKFDHNDAKVALGIPTPLPGFLQQRQANSGTVTSTYKYANSIEEFYHIPSSSAPYDAV